MILSVFAARTGKPLSALLCAITLLAAPASQAAPYPKGKGSGLLLSRDELRQCMAQHERMRAQRDELARLQQQIDEDKDEIKRSGVDLTEQLVWLDRTSESAVTQYNQQATARDKKIDAYEARVAAFNAQVDALKADGAAFAKNCENRRFDEKDEAAIKKGK